MPGIGFDGKTKMETKHANDITAKFREGTVIDQAVEQARIDAMRLHKQLGQPMPVWRDGRIEWVSPEKLSPDTRG